MFRPICKSLLIGVFVVAMVTVGGSRAEATWWRGCGWRGSCWYPSYYSVSYSPGYSSCYTGCYPYNGGWYVGYRRGPLRRALLGRYRAYYGGGCCYSSCYSSCCYDPCCYSTASVSYGPTYSTAVPTETNRVPTPAPPQMPLQTLPPDLPPAEPAVPKPVPPRGGTPPATPPATSSDTPSTGSTSDGPVLRTAGVLTVSVPAEAMVTINGRATKATGTQRRYVSYGLKPGFTYRYVVRAEVIRDGKRFSATRTVHLTSGANEDLAFEHRPDHDRALASLD